MRLAATAMGGVCDANHRVASEADDVELSSMPASNRSPAVNAVYLPRSWQAVSTVIPSFLGGRVRRRTT
jgi:hypothetical protein